jgi:hypothetical protein
VAASDLAQLADVKFWLAGSSGIGAGDDLLLARLITDVSGAIYAYLSRPSLLPRTVTERYDGSGKRRLHVRLFPVLSISSLLVDDVAIPAAPSPSAGGAWPQSGYLLEPWDGAPPGRLQAIDVYGSWVLGQPLRSFAGGRQNVVITYTAGYQVTGEAAVVPNASAFTITPQAPWGPWASDQGVTYASGAALLKVSGTPSQGQYAVTLAQQPDASPSTWSIVYTFAEADAGASVLLSYGFIPAAINNACIEWVAERYRYRTRIGQSSQTVSGQMTSAYSLKGVPDFIKASLDLYRNVVPI